MIKCRRPIGVLLGQIPYPYAPFGANTAKIADLRQKIGDFYFFTIPYSLFAKSNRRFLKVIGNSE